ncbi:hypothetical protein JTE90_029606 [Oedothorax gibbosus]|uniref:Uncharacterized protein n=1 Tax=Oedothorax gibbosus TaxID=931172 RepID=A0AAV6UWE6_9ARAC|nr:hypothetical protein JTE90_029606 [Oedothorax gibbosus]
MPITIRILCKTVTVEKSLPNKQRHGNHFRYTYAYAILLNSRIQIPIKWLHESFLIGKQIRKRGIPKLRDFRLPISLPNWHFGDGRNHCQSLGQRTETYPSYCIRKQIPKPFLPKPVFILRRLFFYLWRLKRGKNELPSNFLNGIRWPKMEMNLQLSFEIRDSSDRRHRGEGKERRCSRIKKNRKKSGSAPIGLWEMRLYVSGMSEASAAIAIKSYGSM